MFFDAVSPDVGDHTVVALLGRDTELGLIGYATDDYAFRTIHLYLEDSADGPVIVAMAVAFDIS